eukprot:TRINITY_DN2183_c0_g1_i1.p4 TRINITY_DN2183_c0_g1~~TRINITY_DN2183_c0_g1_i1.p4  ORF type:complete len:258 (-),score=62.87 TRINITY_DN2183_c0_g1_i1:427-1200(-)
MGLPTADLVRAMPQFIRSHQDLSAMAFTSINMVLFVELVKALHLQPSLSRKITHIGAGPIFLLHWPLFTEGGALNAAIVPLLMTANFALIGAGLLRDDVAVKTLSRTGRRQELLWGPVQYGVIFVACTLFLWRQVTGVCCLMVLAGGDGFADVIGRRFGRHNLLPWSRRKSFAGSAAFWLASVGLSLLLCAALRDSLLPSACGDGLDFAKLAQRTAFIATAATAVESLPFENIDNVTVFAGALLADRVFCKLWGGSR